MCLVTQLCPTLGNPMDCSSPASFLCPWGFSRQEYWSGLLCPPSGDLPNPGIEPWSPTLQQILYHLSHHFKMSWVGCIFIIKEITDFPDGTVVKNLPANAGDKGLIPGLGRSPEGGNGNPLQCSCLGSPMDRGAWRATVHGVVKELDTT